MLHRTAALLACTATLVTVALASGCAAPSEEEGGESDLAAVRSLESVPASEGADVQAIAGMIRQTVQAEYDGQPAGDRAAHRDAHHKHHGCVRAKLDVESSLPSHLQSPVFRPGASYPAWVRYSNGSGSSQDDHEGDGRGMAIKLLDVPGAKILDGADRNATTQDFLLINHRQFFVRNAHDYVAFQQAITENGSPLRYFFPSLNPFSARVREMVIARAITKKKMANPLSAAYFSMAPLLFKNRAVKVAALPCAGEAEAPRDLPSSPNFLREALVDTLRAGSACFDFAVQVQDDAEQMPVEDPTVEWDERVSPFVKVARLTIDAQELDTPARMAHCENLSFTPWHAVPEHRPLGGINRTRKVVYETIARLRHDLNGVDKVEPKTLDVPGE